MKLSDILAREIPGTAEQAGSPLWFAARRGKITGSGVPSIAHSPHARNKGQWTSARTHMKEEYYHKRLWEMIHGESFVEEFDEISKKRIDHGVRCEPLSIDIFQKKYGFTLQKCGAIMPPSDEPWAKRFCVSPDSLVVAGPGIDPNDIPVFETKRPGYKNHQKFLESKTIPPLYWGQVMAQCLVAGSSYAYFASYNPDFPKNYRMLAIRVERDDEYIDTKLIPSIKGFLSKLDRGFAKINDNCGVKLCPV